ncbi:uncharacterized protein [Panulirus ornatus]|uniref:uncharacterized protein isoform X3 n=1 Tax=Panulirus ornatus TaxID=150431 RepID=UPI003A8754FE
MAQISRETLKKEISAILKVADLDTISAKKVRQQLEERLGVDLLSRKKEIDALIMADVEDQANSQSDEEVSEEEVPKGKEDSESEPESESRKASGGRGKKSAFTKSFKLSPELADVVGSDVMPRHEVVKKLWAVIKERELQDPENKQYAICDDQLFKVIGVKRFRTFGMMKHLKDHFLEAA